MPDLTSSHYYVFLYVHPSLLADGSMMIVESNKHLTCGFHVVLFEDERVFCYNRSLNNGGKYVKKQYECAHQEIYNRSGL